DESALYVADYGGTKIGYGQPLEPSYVHRYDLVARKWEQRKAPKIAYRIEAVDGWRFLVLEQDQHVNVALNRWDQGLAHITELSRIGCNYRGDIEFDPNTGRIYHGNSDISSQEISVRRVDGDTVKLGEGTGTYGTAKGHGG